MGGTTVNRWRFGGGNVGVVTSSNRDAETGHTMVASLLAQKGGRVSL